MADENTDNFDNNQHVDINPQQNPTLEPSDFDKMMDDTFEETDSEEEVIPEENSDQKQAETTPETVETSETSEISRTTQEIMDIIAKNELIEKAKRDKIRTIVRKQEKVLAKKEADLNKLIADFDMLTKKRKLTKKALKKAKELKLGTDKIALIKIDMKQTKEMLKSCKNLVEQEESDIKNHKSLIDLLESIL